MSDSNPRSLQGSRPEVGRRPKSVDSHRECSEQGCTTILSRYNLRDTCRLHTPIRFPRIRGELTAD